MAIGEWVEKLGRVLFEAPFESTAVAGDTPEIAEIRLAVWDEVKARSHRVGGRYVFPYDVVRLRVLGVPEDHAGPLRAPFFAQF